jgi:hypothetical protein
LVNNYTTDDENCLINEYQAQKMGSSLSQKKCKEANATLNCTEVLLSTSVVGDYSFIFYVGAVGGNTFQTPI